MRGLQATPRARAHHATVVNSLPRQGVLWRAGGAEVSGGRLGEHTCGCGLRVCQSQQRGRWAKGTVDAGAGQHAGGNVLRFKLGPGRRGRRRRRRRWRLRARGRLRGWRVGGSQGHRKLGHGGGLEVGVGGPGGDHGGHGGKGEEGAAERHGGVGCRRLAAVGRAWGCGRLAADPPCTCPSSSYLVDL